MPPKRTYRKKRYGKTKKVYNKRRYRAKRGERASRANRATASFTTRAIQSASFIPRTTMVRFTLRRTFNVTPTAGVPMRIAHYANSAYAPWFDSLGTWQVQNGNLTDSCNKLSEWLDKNTPVAPNTAKYREGAVVSSSIVCNVKPNPASATTHATHLTEAVVLLHAATASSDWPTSNIDHQTHNAEILSRMPHTKKGKTSVGWNGNHIGCKLSMDYNFKQFNYGKTMSDASFRNDAYPNEKDFFDLAIYPRDVAQFLTGDTLVEHSVDILLTYNVRLWEPNTSVDNVGGFYSSR
jgi:hypothetical protein